MNKQEYIEALRNKLRGIPESDLNDRLSFYSEMIDDYIEEGLTEEEAISRLGDVSLVAEQILSETPLSSLIKERVTPEKKLEAWVIVLIILGAPLWIPIIITLLGILIAIISVLLSVVISFWSIALSIGATAIASIISSVISIIGGSIPGAIMFFGIGVLLIGLTILTFIGCYYFTKGIYILSKKLMLSIKKGINKGEKK